MALVYNSNILLLFVNHKPKERKMFGNRLKLARKKAGFSLRSLAEALDGKISAQAIGKYERGEMMPSSDNLTRLAKTLRVSLEYLLSDQVSELEVVEFRKVANTTARDRARVEATVIDQLQRYLGIEEILEVDSCSWRMPTFGSRYLKAQEESEKLADDLRNEWKLGIDPIPNMTSLLEDRGIKVLILTLPDKVSGLTSLVRRSRHRDRVPAIVVNENFSLERRRYTLAHELAHRLIDNTSPVDHEKASNFFAGAFLIPKDHIVREIGRERKALGYQELIQLKRMYRVSAAALLVRLKQLEIIEESSLVYAFRTFARKWRSIEPEPLEPKGEQGQHEVPRRFERLCYWALAEKLISPAKAGELLQVPLSQIEQGMKGPPESDADCC